MADTVAGVRPITSLKPYIRAWKKGQVITEPGIYSGIPLDVYHSGKLCDGPTVSHSTLWKGVKRSMKHAFDVWPGNPDRAESDRTGKLALGSAIHHLSAGEAEFSKHFAVRPPKWDSWRTDASKAWRGEQIANGFTGVLTPDEVDAIHGVAMSLRDHAAVQAGILGGMVELTIAWRDPPTGLWVLSRPDVLPMGDKMIADLKTTADASVPKIVGRNDEFGHPMQLAIADEGLWQLFGFEASDHVLVFVETERPYVVNVKPIPDFDIAYGHCQFRKAIDEFAACLKSGVWTGYPDDDEAAGYSARYRDFLKWQSDNGRLPKMTGRTPRATLPDAEEGV